jgi:hypothetical protein
VPDAANEEGTLRFAAFKKAENTRRLIGTRLLPSGVWHKTYSILPVQVFSADPLEFPLLRFVKVFSKFVVRNWYSDDARRFQPVDEIIIPLSIQLLALMLHFFYSINIR